MNFSVHKEEEKDKNFVLSLENNKNNNNYFFLEENGMKTIIAVAALLLMVNISNSSEVKKGKVVGGVAYEMPSWFKESFLDIQEDVVEAKEEGKRIMLYFHLNNCPYCKAVLDENFYQGANKKTIQKNFSVIGVNIRGDRQISLNKNEEISERDLARKLKVLYTPTVLIMDKNGKLIFRMNGYRDPVAFANILDYVVTDSYKKTTLVDFVKNKGQKKLYKLASHPAFKTKYNLKGYKKPVAIMFEDKDCSGCDNFHKTILSDKKVTKEMNELLFIRLDAYSDKKIVWFDGTKKSPYEIVKKFKLDYRPGVLLFDEAEEKMRIDGKLYTYHFKEALRYISGGFYKKYDRYHAYVRVRSKELTDKGEVIDISK
jgi:thioredoxin-related protein